MNFRITDKDLESEVNILNNMLSKRGSKVVLKYEPRNGYAAVDYTKNGCKGTLICSVSRRECYEALTTASKVIDLI